MSGSSFPVFGPACGRCGRERALGQNTAVTLTRRQSGRLGEVETTAEEELVALLCDDCAVWVWSPLTARLHELLRRPTLARPGEPKEDGGA